MESTIAEAIGAPFPPVAVLFSDVKPEGAIQFAEGKWGCVMWLLASAAKGRPAVADRDTFGCLGGGVGLGFGNQYESWPGGIQCFYHFLSTGVGDTEEGREAAEEGRAQLRREAYENVLHGEGYIKTPELVKKFVDALPMMEVPNRYVVLKPLDQVGAGERPEVVVFLVDPDRLSALVVLANYDRESNNNVRMPYGAGCQTIGIFAYREATNESPHAIVGLTDLSARRYIARQVGRNDLLSFTVPFEMFREMEANVKGSFLERDTWHALLAAATGDEASRR
jgi:uncharacterized protein (DUF169 family)